MAVGKRIYLRRELPDPEIVEQFKIIPAAIVIDFFIITCFILI